MNGETVVLGLVAVGGIVGAVTMWHGIRQTDARAELQDARRALVLAREDAAKALELYKSQRQARIDAELRAVAAEYALSLDLEQRGIVPSPPMRAHDV